MLNLQTILLSVQSYRVNKKPETGRIIKFFCGDMKMYYNIKKHIVYYKKCIFKDKFTNNSTF